MLIYETDTGYLRVWDGSAWDYLSQKQDTAQGLPAGDSMGLVYITEANPNAASSASINSCFSATYNAYRIVWIPTAYSATSQTQTNLRFRASGTDNISSNYYRARWYYGAGGSTGTTGGAATETTFELADSHTVIHPLSLDVFSPFQTVATAISCKAISWQGVSNTLYGIETVGRMSVTTSYDGFTLYPSTGNFTGKLLVYGYRQA
jgi:hypothetical protein